MRRFFSLKMFLLFVTFGSLLPQMSLRRNTFESNSEDDDGDDDATEYDDDKKLGAWSPLVLCSSKCL